MDMVSQPWMLWPTLSIALIIYYLIILRRDPSAGRLPPGPRPLPLIGNLLDLRGNLHHTLARLARVHGPVMRLKLGLTTTVVISSRDAAMEAFTRHDRRIAARTIPDTLRALGFSERSMIWLPSTDPQWKTLRGIVTSHLFTPRSLAAARGVRERKVRELTSYFRDRAGQVVDFVPVLYGGVMNLLSSAFCSVDVVDIGTESATEMRELMEDVIKLISTPNVSDFFPFLRPLDLQGWHRLAAKHFEKIFHVLGGIVDQYSDETRSPSSTKAPPNDFLGALLELMSAGKLSRSNVTAILFDVLNAGSDTISITVEWAMAELLRNPGIMSKARAEIEGVLGGREAVEEPDVAGMPYLQAVVKEAIRLHHVAPLMLPHLAVEDGVEVGGYAVPKGSRVIFNTWAIMRDPAVWERADEFVPERFLDAAAGVDFKGKNFEFIPFGSGRRLCPGLPMAERVVPFMLASLLHTFEWKLPNGMPAEQLDLSETFGTANVMAIPLKVVPVPIQT